MNYEVIITGIIGLITTVLGIYISHIVAKRKYNTEVDENLIGNMQKSLEFYKQLSDDNRERLEEVLKRNEALEVEVAELRTQLFNLMASMCTDMSCQNRRRKDIIVKKKTNKKTNEDNQ